MAQESETSSKRTRPTYAILRGVSWNAHQLAQRPEEANGQLSYCMTSMLFCAFCLEAFLNHLGQEKVLDWDPLKEKLKPEEKLNVLAKFLGFKPNLGIRPYQTFKSIFTLRNLLVHAKTVTLEDGFIQVYGDHQPSFLADWESKISLKEATRFLDDTKSIIFDLSEHAGVPRDEVFAVEIVKTNETKIIYTHLDRYSSS